MSEVPKHPGEKALIMFSGGQDSATCLTSLTRDVEITINETGLPSTFVPGRNLIFLNFAAAVGFRRGLTTLIGGMCEARGRSGAAYLRTYAYVLYGRARRAPFMGLWLRKLSSV